MSDVPAWGTPPDELSELSAAVEVRHRGSATFVVGPDGVARAVRPLARSPVPSSSSVRSGR